MREGKKICNCVGIPYVSEKFWELSEKAFGEIGEEKWLREQRYQEIPNFDGVIEY